MARANTEELNKLLGTVVETVDQMTKTEITEHDFAKNFLPVVLALHNGQEPVLAGWAARTGSIYNGFTVLSDDTGEEIFTTPGIYPNASFMVNGGMRNMMLDVSHAQKLKLDPTTAYGQHLNSDNAQLAMDSGGRHLIEWYRIFSRYGIRMVNTQTNKIEDNALSRTEAPTNMLDWDDNEFA